MKGPLHVLHYINFSIKHLLSFNSLISTNSARLRLLAKDKVLFEFGLRRAQGPLAALISSKNSYISSFDGVSNVLCGKLYDVPLKGTCAHSFIMSYQGYNCLESKINNEKYDTFAVELFQRALNIRKEMNIQTNLSELVAFSVFASNYKESSIFLVDTYNVYESGIPNSIIIALAINQMNRKVAGIRLDSGDLVSQASFAKRKFKEAAKEYNVDWLSNLKVGASNDINENSLKEYNSKNHEIDLFGIGTNLVTCQLQPFMIVLSGYKKYDLTEENEYKKKFDYNVISELIVRKNSQKKENVCLMRKYFLEEFEKVKDVLK